MALTKEQVTELKDQLKKQVEELPVTQRQEALKQIEEMSDDAIESMLTQQQAQAGQEGDQKSVFRMIVDGDIPSKKVNENDDAIAVVSVRPFSKGHILIIPKKAAADEKAIPKKAQELAEEIAKEMPEKLKATKAEVQPQTLFGEAVLNAIPIYDKPVTVTSQTYEASPEEIEEIFNLFKVVPKISTKPKQIKIKKKTKKEDPVLKIKRRIP